MNERIRELWNQSKTSGVHPEFGEYDKYSAEKFADLIVRECMMIVEGFEITQEVALDEYVDYEASAVLKEHFGVEE